jgi:hypothetical protein
MTCDFSTPGPLEPPNYAERGPVERAIAWLMACGRRVPYCGITRNNGWPPPAATLNVRRLVNLGPTCTTESSFVDLEGSLGRLSTNFGFDPKFETD